MNAITPTVHGIIERRMLVNFRADAGVIRKMLPSYFRPKLVKGWAMAGICLIRLGDLRPRGVPALCGLTSENAAHRIAVEWEEDGITREGVFIPRRDTSSTFQAFAGGRIFPGIHHLANFETREDGQEFWLRMNSRDDDAHVEVHARRTAQIPQASLFASLDEASEFFARGAIGYSATRRPGCCEGLELCTAHRQVEALDVQSVRSSFFDDTNRFPCGTIHFDCALLMQNIQHEWRVLPRLERAL